MHRPTGTRVPVKAMSSHSPEGVTGITQGLSWHFGFMQIASRRSVCNAMTYRSHRSGCVRLCRVAS